MRIISEINKNRHVLYNWQFEASLDKKKWVILDKRIHFTSDPAVNAELEEDRKLLRRKGAISSWGVDSSKVIENPNGFRYFRIVQIGKNSSGSDNLALSGIELYGKVISGKFP
jgi:hypothetical protein